MYAIRTLPLWTSALLSLGLISDRLDAAITVDSLLSGQPAHGSRLVLRTTGAGANAATFVIWDDLEAGDFDSRWAGTTDLVLNTTNQRTPFSKLNAKMNFTSGADEGFLRGPASPVSAKWYVSYWVMPGNNWDWGTTGYGGNNRFLSNIKVVRFWNASNDIDENFLVTYAGWANSLIFNMENVSGSSARGEYIGGIREMLPLGRWHHFQFEFIENSRPGASDGEFRIWLNGKLLRERSGILTRETYSELKRVGVVGFDSAWGPNEGLGETDQRPNDAFFDEFIVANGLNRAELANSPIYEQATHREDQRMISWSDTRVEIQLNQGTFTNGSVVYLFLTDASGARSPGYRLVIGGNAAPTVAITSPTNSAVFQAPANIPIAATANDADGISKVEFLQGSALLGTDTTGPYGFSWTNVAPGNYTIIAKATDNTGAVTTSTPVSVSVVGSNDCMLMSRWTNRAFATQTGIFTYEFEAQPFRNNIDAVLALSKGIATNYTDMAVSVRFFTNGVIEARNGSAYEAVTRIPYSASERYRFGISVDLPRRRFSATVTPVGGVEQVLARDFAFRGEQAAVTQLDHFVGQGPSGSAEICNFTVRPATNSTSALKMLGTRISGNMLRLSFPTTTNKIYFIEFSDTLNLVTWESLVAVTGTGSEVSVFDNFGAGRSRFYRLREN